MTARVIIPVHAGIRDRNFTDESIRYIVMTPGNALEFVAELENLIELGGRTDPPTQRRIEEITALLEDGGEPAGVLDDTLHQVRSWSQILFSERKQQKSRRAADDIKNILRVHCISLRKQIQGGLLR